MKVMKVQQFFDDSLAHMSYAVLSDKEIAVIDPARNINPYLNFARKNNGEIKYVFITHTHADFVSGQIELSKKTGAKVYTSKNSNVFYDHLEMNNNDSLSMGHLHFRFIDTPGHTKDSMCIILSDEIEKDYAVFTGDTIFFGDVGRPDIPDPSEGEDKKEELASDLFHSIQKIKKLGEEVKVYPAHGAGSLCGKSISDRKESTVGIELEENQALKISNKDEFLDFVLKDQPFIPEYFKYDKEANKHGVASFEESLSHIPRVSSQNIKKENKTIDCRNESEYKKQHKQGSINIMEGDSFETWLGTIVRPDEKFFLVAKDEDQLRNGLERVAKIAYEKQMEGVSIYEDQEGINSPAFDFDHFRDNPDEYYILDVRNVSEVEERKIFEQAINIPLARLEERISEISTDKPIVVHCSGGYRSAVAHSILENHFPGKNIFDLSDKIDQF